MLEFGSVLLDFLQHWLEVFLLVVVQKLLQVGERLVV
jgi:hypothetical protein